MLAAAAVDRSIHRLNADEWPSFDCYEALSPDRREVRLLNVGYDERLELISCRLTSARLVQCPQYIALSYYWGAPPPFTDLCTILVNDIEILVRPSIYGFLYQLCQHFGHVTVWLDVLCINQKDVRERNRQVSLMADIFEGATCVYAWLGDGTSDTDYAFDYFNGSLPASMAQRDLLDNCISQVTSRPYWSRVWICQELVLAREIVLMCGTRLCTWEQFMTAIKQDLTGSAVYLSALSTRQHEPTVDEFEPAQWIIPEADDRVSSRPQARVLNLIYERQRYGSESSSRKLSEIVGSMFINNCSDPRDRLFGYRGIASDRDEIKVDYSSSLVDLSFQFLLRNLLDQHSKAQLQRLKTGTFYKYELPLLNKTTNGRHLRACMDMLTWMRITENDLQGSLTHHPKDNIIVLGRPNAKMRMGRRPGWETIIVDFELPLPRANTDTTKSDVRVELEVVHNSPRQLGVQKIRLTDSSNDGNTVTLQNLPLPSAFELCSLKPQATSSATYSGFTFTPVPVHMSRAALLLLTTYATTAEPPGAIAQHFASIHTGQTAPERLCNCTVDLVPFAQLPKLRRGWSAAGEATTMTSMTTAQGHGQDVS